MTLRFVPRTMALATGSNSGSSIRMSGSSVRSVGTNNHNNNNNKAYTIVKRWEGKGNVISIPELTWRRAAREHRHSIRKLLEPGLTQLSDPINSGIYRQAKDASVKGEEFVWTALDPKHPVYNFLIEYYGLKGVKGPKRLSRWSPDPSLILCSNDSHSDNDDCMDRDMMEAVVKASEGYGGIFLENATEEDLGGTLHLRGSIPIPSSSSSLYGVLYSPALFHNRHLPSSTTTNIQLQTKAAAPYQWYHSILSATQTNEPVFHCHGLHEWAMQYHPHLHTTPPPPSSKYQSHLPLRVSQTTINATVERRGISCTHVDALRFFAPDAAPLNHHGSHLHRTDQLSLEQRACVHAHMDLLKIALRLLPFCSSHVLLQALDVALQARTLDVEASPYDVSLYTSNVVPVETREGRRVYRERQVGLMHRADPVRERLKDLYSVFLELAFDDHVLRGAMDHPGDERFALAEPGGLPWRRSLIPRDATTS